MLELVRVYVNSLTEFLESFQAFVVVQFDPICQILDMEETKGSSNLVNIYKCILILDN